MSDPAPLRFSRLLDACPVVPGSSGMVTSRRVPLLDIADIGINPLCHFLSIGAFEQRSPNPQYPPGYMADTRRVVARELNPFVYWLEHPQETCIPSFEDYIEWRFKEEYLGWICGCNPLVLRTCLAET